MCAHSCVEENAGGYLMHHVVMCVYVVKDLIPLYIKALSRLFPCVCLCVHVIV